MSVKYTPIFTSNETIALLSELRQTLAELNKVVNDPCEPLDETARNHRRALNSVHCAIYTLLTPCFTIESTEQ
jgi:hypothetical protein